MIVPYEKLQELFGGNSPADVAARMGRANVRFLLGKSGRPLTTEVALNFAMGLPTGELLVNTGQHHDARPTIKVL